MLSKHFNLTMKKTFSGIDAINVMKETYSLNPKATALTYSLKVTFFRVIEIILRLFLWIIICRLWMELNVLRD